MVLIIIGGGALGGLSEIYEVCVSSFCLFVLFILYSL